MIIVVALSHYIRVLTTNLRWGMFILNVELDAAFLTKS